MKAYQIKISLLDSSPLIWRRVIVPAEITFKRLHDVIQFVMGWNNQHLYEFEIADQRIRIANDDEDAYPSDPEWENKRPEKTKIDRFMGKDKPLSYVYDYGDYWKYQIVLEDVLEDYPFGYPRCLDGEGACPPEDVGGIAGYADFLKAWQDPHHPEHRDMVEWAEGQGYREFDLGRTNRLMSEHLKLKKVK